MCGLDLFKRIPQEDPGASWGFEEVMVAPSFQLGKAANAAELQTFLQRLALLDFVRISESARTATIRRRRKMPKGSLLLLLGLLCAPPEFQEILQSSIELMDLLT